jgi:hypothetical protein
MGKTIVICGFLAWALVWIVENGRVPCNCAVPMLPENHFIEETFETETCVDKDRKTIVTRKVSSAKVEIGERNE